ncbi:MAG: HAD-IA family hydrolase [Verrucomicrobia bacterium]|jgi:putative hydrolase of the HAD superfamily|nr:HAD-IA family hydrolase [Verrucomicrobiota bacterium]
MTFLFDIGNVLLNLHFDRFHAAVLDSPNASLPDELVALKDPYESGAISDAEFVAHCLDGLASSMTTGQFTAAWQDVFSPNEPMWTVVRQLKADAHRLILFSNTNGLHCAHFLAKFPVFRHFDGHQFSHDVGVMKPHPDFYRKAIKCFKLDPSDTIYLDDLPENIATGRAFGFTCWCYEAQRHKDCLQWLAGQGVLTERS